MRAHPDRQVDQLAFDEENSATSPPFLVASWHRGIAASRHRGIAASRHRGIAASWHRGLLHLCYES
jgi:hypothetical protein